ncbi:TetR/AcrR family transcriptional regulator [Microlunatus soli]|uniref:DNA-binding transcriptional regulator, AcrR family n=1 Tax=Microlunatus soli TaxID=630515 RepID=A0A1H1Z4E8_9ACTN|nr:TetR family transcriptional regulator [Microlunatus soli]SDT28621.1 DNA-binding transcriptional regulator, AcrR family [Microlunatus soli]
MSPRRSAAHAQQTRHLIVTAGVDLASVEGLDAITLGRLAEELTMSKSGVIGHFGSKLDLQLAVLNEAVRVYRREVIVPAAHAAPGLARLRKLVEAWISHLERGVYPGGCFFTQVTTEYDDRPGPVRDVARQRTEEWRAYLAEQISTAVQDGDFSADTDVDQVIFEATGLMLSLNHTMQLDLDPKAIQHARAGFERLIAACMR